MDGVEADGAEIETDSAIASPEDGIGPGDSKGVGMALDKVEIDALGKPGRKRVDSNRIDVLRESKG